MLVCWFGVSSARVEVDRERGSGSGTSGQRLVNRVVEASGEGLDVLPAGECDGDWSWLVGGNFHLP